MSTIRLLFALWLMAVSLSSLADCPDNIGVSPLVASTSDDIIASFFVIYISYEISHSINGNVINVHMDQSSDFPATGGFIVCENLGKLSQGVYTVNLYGSMDGHQYLFESFTVQVNAPQASAGTSVPTLDEWSLVLLAIMLLAISGIQLGRRA